MFLSGIDFWRYLDKAYNSVPGSGGSNPLHAIPCVHGLKGGTVDMVREAGPTECGVMVEVDVECA